MKSGNRLCHPTMCYPEHEEDNDVPSPSGGVARFSELTLQFPMHVLVLLEGT